MTAQAEAVEIRRHVEFFSKLIEDREQFSELTKRSQWKLLVDEFKKERQLALMETLKPDMTPEQQAEAIAWARLVNYTVNTLETMATRKKIEAETLRKDFNSRMSHLTDIEQPDLSIDSYQGGIV